jgi:cytochrome P450
MVQIQEEIENVDVMDANALGLLPHFNAVINEVLRIMPPAMTGNGRMTGPNGITVDGHFIPPNTKVTAPKFVIMRQERAFKRADEFIPERWTTRPELIRDRQAFGPFSFGKFFCLYLFKHRQLVTKVPGHRQCPGRVLAYAELRLTTALFLKRYNVSFADEYDPQCMWRELRDQVTAQPGLVLCEFTPRV